MADSESETFEFEWTVSNDSEAEDLYNTFGGVNIGDVVGEYSVPQVTVRLNHECVVADVTLRSFKDSHQTLYIWDLEEEIAPGPFELKSIHTTEDSGSQDLQITVVLE